MKLQIILIPKLFISLLINYKYKQTNPHRQPGGFFPKNFFRIFFVYTSFKGLSPLFDHLKGEGGEGGYPHGSKGRGMGGKQGGGDIKNPPVNYRRGGGIFDISK